MKPSAPDTPEISPLAGKPAPPEILCNIARLVTAYYSETPDPDEPLQRVAFGTSGHRGSSLERSFNEAHVLAITQAICLYRKRHGTSGPLYLGIDTHALSEPASASALEVLAANGVRVMIAPGGEYTPTPAVSHAILTYNRRRRSGLADGIVVTPSHNPPDNGGFKYNPANGGPADTRVTGWIENKANEILRGGLKAVRRMPLARALRSGAVRRHDFLRAYVEDLNQVVDMDAIRGSRIRMGVDPLGGAGVHYWPAIAEHYRLDLDVISQTVDATFRFMTVDWDGKIRMDPSSRYAMQGLIGARKRYDIAYACDTDHDRHGIVTRSAGLLAPNDYLATMIGYLFSYRPNWSAAAAVGKTVVSTQMIDRVCSRLGRKLYEVPVGFKWFAAGLQDGSLGFGGEESAGASFLRRDGSVWTTDKDGLVPALLSAEMTARCGRDPAELYQAIEQACGRPYADRLQAPATPAQKSRLLKLDARQVRSTTLAGEPVQAVLTRAPGNGAPIGGLKVVTGHGWFAARPSGTEDIYKIYAESFRDKRHLREILHQAQDIVDRALRGKA
ncbi:phosphoglucomutase (alpha-D-glucose-1,6-bisphosphate-dependent) [Candidimonas nitroreducens]|uniref:Phosphoglucomutase n=1 Tax=Candidimonas nitroreducens TaxID=683354 RepID=A0A225N5Y2_9BURK|nr:phosphoglucomutase (alpha-D-glucose-1,6-bisphosphate-dependent) [Candidimonas nitroreducens]OWT66419.1 phosphoglucomutase, alpha-D-glucose phosphate-specific [Candidimonas nitroreducens]